MNLFKIRTQALFLTTILLSCNSHGLKIVNDEEIKFVQRESKTIEGSEGDVEIYVGDVTMGTTQVKIKGIENNKLYFNQDMRQNDEGFFQYSEKKYYRIKVNKFENHLLHDDLAFISIREIDTKLGKQKASAITENTSTELSGDDVRISIEKIRESKLKYIRNGEILSDSDMAVHIESKYLLNQKDIRTKEDFYERILTKSMTTGETYKVIKKNDTLKLVDWIKEN